MACCRSCASPPEGLSWWWGLSPYTIVAFEKYVTLLMLGSVLQSTITDCPLTMVQDSSGSTAPTTPGDQKYRQLMQCSWKSWCNPLDHVCCVSLLDDSLFVYSPMTWSVTPRVNLDTLSRLVKAKQFSLPSFWAVLGSVGKFTPRWHQKVHFELFWALVTNWLPDGLRYPRWYQKAHFELFWALVINWFPDGLR